MDHRRKRPTIPPFLFGKSDTQWTTSMRLAIPFNPKLKSSVRFTGKVLTAVVLYEFAAGRHDCISGIILR
jgi:hypothetical protein